MTPTDAHPATSGGSRTGADNGSRPGVGSSTGTGTGRRPVTSRSGRGSAPSRPAGRRSSSLHSRRLLGYAGTYLVLALAALITLDRKSTRLNSSHVATSYAVFCWEKKTAGTGRRLP